MALPGDEFYMKAFWDLSTERQLGMGVGPIPWSRIFQYGNFYQLDEDLLDPFIQIIREMDNGYLEFQQDKKEKEK